MSRAVQCFPLVLFVSFCFERDFVCTVVNFTADQKMLAVANSPLNVLILGNGHIYWLGECVRMGNPAGLFTDF